MIRIQTKKGDTCPICTFSIIAPNCWIRYHVAYNPPLVILACKYCNFIEKKIRTGIPINKNDLKRVKKIINFHKKLNKQL